MYHVSTLNYTLKVVCMPEIVEVGTIVTIVLGVQIVKRADW